MAVMLSIGDEGYYKSALFFTASCVCLEAIVETSRLLPVITLLALLCIDEVVDPS